MIVKIPVYFEISEKFHPDEVSEVIAASRTRFTKTVIKEIGKNFLIDILGREVELKILTEAQLQKKLSGFQGQ